MVPDGLTTEEVESSVCELGDITPDETKDFDVVVVGAGAAGVPAAGWAAELGGHVALLQKQSIVVSQGNCAPPSSSPSPPRPARRCGCT